MFLQGEHNQRLIHDAHQQQQHQYDVIYSLTLSSTCTVCFPQHLSVRPFSFVIKLAKLTLHIQK